jgi:hypothetical protein
LLRLNLPCHHIFSFLKHTPMINKYTPLMFMLLAAVLLGACNKDVLRGDGPTITQSRTLPSFTSVAVSGTRSVEIIPSAESRVELSGYQNLVDAYSSSVTNGRLSFSYPAQTAVRRDNISLKIYTPQLGALWMDGDMKVLMKNGWQGQSLTVQLSGNGELRMEGGQLDSLVLRSSGNGLIYAEPLQARVAEVDLSGYARIQVRASEKLEVRISGDGEVHYWGNPMVTSQISGRGKTVKH